MLDPNEQRVIDDIAEFGWHLILVEEDATGPGFVYSVGMMHTLGHPEIIIFGLPRELSAAVINGMGDQIQEGRNFAELGLFEDLLEGYACKLISVDEQWHTQYLGYAMWHRRHVGKIESLEVLQCLWPDKQGKFPDEEGCHPEAIARQPVLG